MEVIYDVYYNIPKSTNNTSNPPKAEERTVDEIRKPLLEKEKLLDQKIQEAKQEKQDLAKKKQEADRLV